MLRKVEKGPPEYRKIALSDEAGAYHYLQDEEETDIRLKLRELSEEEVSKLYSDFLVYDFPEDELKKLDLIFDLRNRGTYLTFAVYDRDAFVGYTFITTEHDKEFYILDYLAIISTLRGKGYGSRILSLLSSYFSDKRELICEVEDPFMAEDSETKILRKRRMDFYISNGWRDTGLSVFMFGVDYRILSSPVGNIADPRDTLNDYRKVYIEMVGEEVLAKNMRINIIQEF